jgi:hypothetical protein
VVVVIEEVISLCQQVCHCKHHPIWYAAMQKTHWLTLHNNGTWITWYMYSRTSIIRNKGGGPNFSWAIFWII